MKGKERKRRSVFTECVMADILMKLNFCKPGVPVTVKVVATPMLAGVVLRVGRVAKVPSAFQSRGGV